MGQRLVQRDIVLVRFPFSDASATKLRPALVISNDAYHASRQDVLVCAITSQTVSLEYGVLLHPHQLEKGTLPNRSTVRSDTLGRLHRSLIKKHLGKASVVTHELVVQKIRSLIN